MPDAGGEFIHWQFGRRGGKYVDYYLQSRVSDRCDERGESALLYIAEHKVNLAPFCLAHYLLHALANHIDIAHTWRYRFTWKMPLIHLRIRAQQHICLCMRTFYLYLLYAIVVAYHPFWGVRLAVFDKYLHLALCDECVAYACFGLQQAYASGFAEYVYLCMQLAAYCRQLMDSALFYLADVSQSWR